MTKNKPTFHNENNKKAVRLISVNFQTKPAL